MPSLLYDNLDDVISKLGGTIVYYGKQPVVVKQVEYDEDDPQPQKNQKFKLLCTKTLSGRSTGYTIAKLDDPLLNYKHYNLGYANQDHGAIWWYRTPLKQYRQGLKNEQMRYRISNKGMDVGYGFNANKHIEAMLMDIYPSVEEIVPKIVDKEDLVMAIHRDFAVKWDRMHRDMILEYKGKPIGCADMDFKNVKLLDEHQHLTETVRDVFNVR